MTKDEIIQLMTNNPAMQLATVDEQGQPHTRGMMMYSADKDGIIFHTAEHKDLYRQLKHQPKVEVSFVDMKNFIQIRVRGCAVELDDQALKEKIVNTPGREFLKPWVAERGYRMMRVFHIQSCVADAWTMQMNFEYPRKEVIF
ncbi:MAG: pyridoxamine 5'-phosphate oxidase family protein [Deltaproteobacteria bacterium]|nr:pyridoxamine 5'-phosphate oxidase family protein [Deltaproteobacteria bacterium]MBN2674068.1 pyridoxamine 5'-phosphate oxidase family protein [Deltaproteobacteria bacterium]